MLEAALAAEAATGDVAFGRLAERAYAWFTGANDLGLPVADPAEGACHDGLGSGGLNPNQGAESTLAWLVAVERMRAHRSQRCLRLIELRPAGGYGACQQVLEHLAEVGRGDRDRRVRGAVVDAQQVALLVEQPTARKDDVGHVAGPLVRLPSGSAPSRRCDGGRRSGRPGPAAPGHFGRARRPR